MEKDIFGFEGNGRRLGGPFGDELIAGVSPKIFFFYFFYWLLLLFKKFSSRKLLVLFLFSSAIITFGFLFAGNRVPFMMFFLTSILIFIFLKIKEFIFYQSLLALLVSFILCIILT